MARAMGYRSDRPHSTRPTQEGTNNACTNSIFCYPVPMNFRSLIALIVIFWLVISLANAVTLHLKITGISGPAANNVTQRLEALQQNYGENLTRDQIRDFYQHAPENIRQALQPYGYFKAAVKEEQLTYQGDDWTASFHISPGPPLKIASVDLAVSGAGENDPELQKLIRHFPLQPGQSFDSSAYESAKELLFQTANNQGYIKAELAQKEIRIDLHTYTAKIILHLNTGPRYYFGNVTFTSCDLAPEFLQRFITFHSGEPFSSEKLLQLQQAMGNSHYFKQVIVTPDIAKAQHLQVPINIFVTLPKSQQYSIGAGYGTFTGPRVTLSTDLRRTTATGQHFTAQIKLSPVLKGLAAKYFIPGKNPLTDQYTLGADAQKFIPKNGESFSETFSGSYIKNIHEWQNTSSLNYLIERYQVENDPSEVSRLLYPSFTTSRIKADNMTKPTFGNSISFTLQGANEHVLASTSFIQGEAKEKYIFSPSDVSRVILRGDLGYTVVNDLSRLPLTLNFFAGGLGSVRGYPYSSLGPGRYLETASVEYQHKIIGDWDGAVFYDVGNASNHFNNPIMRGDGFGVIYNSIIGAIQVYVGRAESKPGKPYSIEFSIGPDF